MSLFAQGTELVGKVKSADGKLRTAELLEVCRSILPIVGEWCGGVACRSAAGRAPVAAGDPRAGVTALRRRRPLLPLNHPPRLPADKLGTGFALVRHDVGGNIERLATCAATKPAEYEADVFQMVRDDVAAGTHTASTSVTKGLLWLKRCAGEEAVLASAYIPPRGAGWLHVPGLPDTSSGAAQPACNPSPCHHASDLPCAAHACRAMEFIVALLDSLQAHPDTSLSQAASETYYATLQRYHGWIVTGTFTLALKLVPSRCALLLVGAGGGCGRAGGQKVLVGAGLGSCSGCGSAGPSQPRTH